MPESYSVKYNSNPVIPLKAVIYFEDINFNEPVKMVREIPFAWKKIEKRLKDIQRFPDRLFQPL